MIAVVLSLVFTAAHASAVVAQARLAGRTEPDAGVLRLLGRGAWWSAVALNAGGALLHVAALKYGPLTLVQPLGALTLVAAVPLGARAAGRRVTRTERRGTIVTLLGLGGLLTTAGGRAGGEFEPGAGSASRVVIVSRGAADRRALRPEAGRAPVGGS